LIENNERIQSMLHNILEKVSIIQKDFERNGETHYDYILEKLSSAQWDLNVLIKIADDRKNLDKRDKI